MDGLHPCTSSSWTQPVDSQFFDLAILSPVLLKTGTLPISTGKWYGGLVRAASIAIWWAHFKHHPTLVDSHGWAPVSPRQHFIWWRVSQITKLQGNGAVKLGLVQYPAALVSSLMQGLVVLEGSMSIRIGSDLQMDECWSGQDEFQGTIASGHEWTLAVAPKSYSRSDQKNSILCSQVWLFASSEWRESKVTDEQRLVLWEA